MIGTLEQPEGRNAGGGAASQGAGTAVRRLERQQAALVRVSASALREDLSIAALAAELAREAGEALDAVAIEVHVQGVPVRWPAEAGVAGSPAATVPVGPPGALWGSLSARAKRSLAPVEIEFLTALAQILAGALQRERLRSRPEGDVSSRVADLLAHDLNNVLAAVGASSSAVEAMLPTVDGFAEDFRLIDEAIKRGGRLVRRLLGFLGSRPDRERVFELGELASDATSVVERLLLGTVTLAPAALPESLAVRGLRAELEPLLVSLVMSAAQATVPGETLRLEARHLDADAVTGTSCAVGFFAAAAGADLIAVQAAAQRTQGRVQVVQAADRVGLICRCGDPGHEV